MTYNRSQISHSASQVLKLSPTPPPWYEGMCGPIWIRWLFLSVLSEILMSILLLRSYTLPGTDSWVQSYSRLTGPSNPFFLVFCLAWVTPHLPHQVDLSPTELLLTPCLSGSYLLMCPPGALPGRSRSAGSSCWPFCPKAGHVAVWFLVPLIPSQVLRLNTHPALRMLLSVGFHGTQPRTVRNSSCPWQAHRAEQLLTWHVTHYMCSIYISE